MPTIPVAIACSLACSAAAQVDLQLRPSSHFEDGCHDPCACPILFLSRLEGTCSLRLVNENPLFSTYAVENIEWVAGNLGWQITGAGVYIRGGEVALMQHLVLDLQSDAGRDYHLESDWQPVLAEFPDIRTTADDQVDTGCRYALINLDASGRCIADFNADGGIDGADVESFFNAWESADPAADVNHDGGIDGADLGFFFPAWERGC